MEFMEEVIERDPAEAFPAVKDGEVLMHRTGDPLIDAWERAIADGETPDVAGALSGSPEVAAWLKPSKDAPEMPPDFHDDYTAERG